MKSTQISIKLNPRIKARAEKAAAILGLSLSDYVVKLIDEDATCVLNGHGRLTLERYRFETFVAVCKKAAGSNPALQEALLWAGRSKFDKALTSKKTAPGE